MAHDIYFRHCRPAILQLSLQLLFIRCFIHQINNKPQINCKNILIQKLKFDSEAKLWLLLRQLIRRLCLAELYFHSIKVNYLLIAVWGKINDKIILISIIRYMKTNLKILTIFSIKNCCNSLHTAYCHVVMSSLHIVMCVYYLLVDYYVYFVYVCMFATTKW